MTRYNVTLRVPTPELLLETLTFAGVQKLTGVIVDPVGDEPEVKMVKLERVLDWEAFVKDLGPAERFVLRTLWGYNKGGVTTEYLAIHAKQPPNWVRYVFDRLVEVAREYQLHPDELFYVSGPYWCPGSLLLAHDPIPLDKAPEGSLAELAKGLMGRETETQDWAKVIEELSPGELRLLYLIRQEPITGKITENLQKLSGISSVDTLLHNLTKIFGPGLHGYHTADIFSEQREEQGFRYIPGPALLANEVPEPEPPVTSTWAQFVAHLNSDEIVLLRVLKNATSGKTTRVSVTKLAKLMGQSEACVLDSLMLILTRSRPPGDILDWGVLKNRGSQSLVFFPGPLLIANSL